MSIRFFHLPSIMLLFLAACAHIEVPGNAKIALEGTYWKLVQLGENTVFVHERQREPSLILNPEGHHAGGSGGCNQFAGTYTLEGNHLNFSQLAMTRMACAQGMDTEAAFSSALAQVRSWQISGKQLELYDAGGELLAKFVAQPTE